MERSRSKPIGEKSDSSPKQATSTKSACHEPKEAVNNNKKQNNPNAYSSESNTKRKREEENEEFFQQPRDKRNKNDEPDDPVRNKADLKSEQKAKVYPWQKISVRTGSSDFNRLEPVSGLEKMSRKIIVQRRKMRLIQSQLNKGQEIARGMLKLQGELWDNYDATSKIIIDMLQSSSDDEKEQIVPDTTAQYIQRRNDEPSTSDANLNTGTQQAQAQQNVSNRDEDDSAMPDDNDNDIQIDPSLESLEEEDASGAAEELPDPMTEADCQRYLQKLSEALLPDKSVLEDGSILYEYT